MPKLPTWQNLSAVTPQAAGPASISPGAASGLAAAYRSVGRGIESGFDAIGGALKKREDEQDAEDLLAAHTEWQKRHNDLQRKYQTDNDYETYGTRFPAESNEITYGIAERIKNEKLRKEFIGQKQKAAEAYRDSIMDRGLRLKKEKNVNVLRNSLESSVGIYTDPKASTVDKEMARVGARGSITVAEQAGWLTPGEAIEARQKVEREMYLREQQNRVNADPAGLLEDIRVYQRDIAKGKAGRTRSDRPFEIQQYDGERKVGRNRNKPVRGVIAHYTEGGTSMDGLASWANQSNTGYNYYIDRDGNVIEFAGDDVVMNHAGQGRRRPGDKAPHLGNGNTVGIGIMTPKGGKATPEQIEAFRRLTGELSKKHGFSAKDIYGHGEVAVGHRKSTEAMDVVGAVRDQGFAGAEGEAGPAGPRDGEQPKDDVTPQEAGEMPPQEIQRREELARKFDPLKPEDIYKLQAEALRRMKVQEAKERQNQRDLMKSDIASIRDTGVPNNQLDLSAMKPDQRKAHEAERKRAFVFHETTKDFGEITPSDFDKRIADLHSALKPGSDDFKQNKDLIQSIRKAWDEEQRLRERDPALAVSDNPALAAYQERLAEMRQGGINTIDSWEGMIETRLQVQEDIGVPELERRALTEAEAFELMPDLRDLSPNEVRDAIEAATNKARQTYGQYARKALMDALRFRKMVSNDRALGILRGALRSDVEGVEDSVLTGRDLRALEIEGDLMGRLAAGQGFMADDYGIEPDPADTAPPPQVGPQSVPTQAQYEWAKSRGADGARLYDQMFGAGAFERSRQYLEGRN